MILAAGLRACDAETSYTHCAVQICDPQNMREKINDHLCVKLRGCERIGLAAKIRKT